MSLILAIVCIVFCACLDLPPSTLSIVMAIILAGGLAGLGNGK